MSSPRPGVHFVLRPIEAHETRAMRRELLRPEAPDEELAYPGDEDDTTLHVGAFVEDELVGIASVYREAADWDPMPGGAWRLRGVATAEDYRLRKVGKFLVATCLQHAFEHGGTSAWCNARRNSRGFYESLGFETHGEPFEIEGIGEHIVMWIALEP